ncbi:hypothetical protein Trydic_g15271 [Trypoxylus dichotomus]
MTDHAIGYGENENHLVRLFRLPAISARNSGFRNAAIPAFRYQSSGEFTTAIERAPSAGGAINQPPDGGHLA